MRAFIAVCLFAAANAAFINVQQVGQPLVNAAVADFVAELQKGPGLAEFLQVPNNELLQAVEKQTQTQLGQQLSEQLQQILAQIQAAIDHGQQVSQSLIDKAKEIFGNLQQIGANTSTLLAQFIQELIQIGQVTLGNLIGKRDLSNITNLVNTIHGEINTMVTNLISTLQGALGVGKRDLIGDLLGGILSNVLTQLGNVPVVGPILQNILGKRDADPKVWNLIVDSIQQIIGSLSGQLDGFKQWIQQILGETSGVLQGHLANIQELAQQVLANVNQLTASTVNQAIEFFRPYQNDLGVLWQQLLNAANQINGQLTG